MSKFRKHRKQYVDAKPVLVQANGALARIVQKRGSTDRPQCLSCTLGVPTQQLLSGNPFFCSMACGFKFGVWVAEHVVEQVDEIKAFEATARLGGMPNRSSRRE